MKQRLYLFSLICLIINICNSQNRADSFGKELFKFNSHVKSDHYRFLGKGYTFQEGIDEKSLTISSEENFNNLILEDFKLNSNQSFSVQFWVKTTSKKPTVFLSQKQFTDKSILSQKNTGWVLYSSGGTLGWSIGSGNRRLNYERDNGNMMPICDGEWHQITMTYNKVLSETRLYYDAQNIAVYKVGFDFVSEFPLTIGAQSHDFDYKKSILLSIKEGRKELQKLVDTFNMLGLSDVAEDEFIALLVSPEALIKTKLNNNAIEIKRIKNRKSDLLKSIKNIHNGLYNNPYTVTQNYKLTMLKPVSQIYSLKNGEVSINEFYAKKFGEQERLYPSNFSIDNLSIWGKAINSEAILNTYKKYKKINPFQLKKRVDTITIAVWNIWHGGIHYSKKNDGWDSRLQIANMLKKQNADVVLMQETYSAGDFIAAELGYHFATTSDWDYCHQGSNISVLSRYPIKELHVNKDTEFMNVAVKLTLSEAQEIYAMSNWYGMASFTKVYDFHRERFDEADKTPVLFGGDFNAVPHTDGGNSIASVKLLENGFTDAFRSLFPNVEAFPGYTHQWADRIDQLYYKGEKIKNIDTKVIYAAHGGFPSDHFMIVSKFEMSN